jgi:hypothetical protein
VHFDDDQPSRQDATGVYGDQSVSVKFPGGYTSVRNAGTSPRLRKSHPRTDAEQLSTSREQNDSHNESSSRMGESSQAVIRSRERVGSAADDLVLGNPTDSR